MKENELNLVKGLPEWFETNFQTIAECFTPEAARLFDGTIEEFAMDVYEDFLPD